MKKTTLTLFLIFLFSLTAFSQTENKKQDCPILTVIPPPSVVNAGETMKFSAKISGGIDLAKLKFNWTVDKGTIIEGQGTDTIIVEFGDEYDEVVTATVYVSDKKNCDLSASESGIIVPLCVLPDLVDEFGDIPEENIRARFDNMFIRLQSAPEAKAAVINYGSDKAIQTRVELLNNHIKLRGYDKNKIIIKNGGKEETIRTRIWLVPEGIDPDVFN